MKCPSCGSNEAYVGFNDIDCPNKTCRHFQGGAASLSSSVSATPMPRNPGTMPAPSPGTWPNVWPNLPPVMAPPNLTVRIIKQHAKQNNVQVSFIAGGDPGQPDKEVEIQFDVGGGPRVCTLSHPNVVSVTGVDADGATVYTTNWLCTQDGVRPTDSFTLTATIY